MVSNGYGTVRVPKAAELVASTLRMQIVTGALSADDSLPPEGILMEQFGVSRPTLREAFRILESESLIDVRRGARGGARIMVPDIRVASRHVGYVMQHRGTTLNDVYAARTMLELPLGEAVANNADDEDLSVLDFALETAADDLNAPSAYAEHDIQFHLLVAELAGNQTMRTMVDLLYGVIGQARRRYAQTTPDEQLRKEHDEVHRTHSYFVDRIRNGDREKARSLWGKHLREVEHRYMIPPLAGSVVEMMG